MADRIQNGSIEHEGIVEEVQMGTLKINLQNVDHCAACHAKAGCSVSSSNDKMIEVQNNAEGFVAGERVRVSLDADLGPRALFFGYVLPFILVFTVLMLSWALTNREGLSALLALGSLVPYYAGLSFFRDRLQKTFSFRISRM
jgi:sigma-E factor negative regulatory protein RseC